MELVNSVTLVCIAGAIIGIIFLTIGSIFELINYLSKGKLKNSIVHFFEEENSE